MFAAYIEVVTSEGKTSLLEMKECRKSSGRSILV